MTKEKTKKTSHAKTAHYDDSVLSFYMKEINRIPLLSRKEEDETARAAAKGNMAARNKLVNANLRFVVTVAKKYQGQGMPLSDLINEGNIGLINAVGYFDADKGYHFISYAVWWIRQAIMKALNDKSRMIRLPLNRTGELARINKARKEINESMSAKEEIQEIARLSNLDARHVNEILSISRDMVSLASPVDRAGELSAIGDFIEDDKYKTPEEAAMEAALSGEMKEVIDTLGGKEADIIRARYGIGNGVPKSLQEIGEAHNITKERVRQIEVKAIKRLKSPCQRHMLECYVA
jgi:RNA polymerase primary sigma factor